MIRNLPGTRRVLWVNSIGLRRPRLGTADLGRVVKKIRRALQKSPPDGGRRTIPAPEPGATEPLRIVQALIFPMARGRAVRSLNRALLERSVGRAAREAGLERPVLWTSLPSAADALGALGESAVVARAARVEQRVHTEHDAWHLNDPRRRRVARLALAAARPVLVADAPHVADAIVTALGCVPPLVILNGVDTVRFAPGNRAAARQALGLQLDALIVGVAARLEPVKGVDVAIKALAGMRRPAVLAIAGTGSQQGPLRQLASELNVADRVCLSSRAEGLPLSLLEAQASGVAVVASAVGGVPAASCPQSGRLVRSEDVAGFAAALDAVLGSTTGSPREFVAHTASLAASAGAYLELYRIKTRE